MPGMHRTPISLEKPSASSKENREQEAKGVNPVIEGKEPVSPPEQPVSMSHGKEAEHG